MAHVLYSQWQCEGLKKVNGKADKLLRYKRVMGLCLRYGPSYSLTMVIRYVCVCGTTPQRNPRYVCVCVV